KKAPAGRRGAFGTKGVVAEAGQNLAQTGFFVLDVFAYDRVKFFHDQFVGRVALVLCGGVEMPGTCGRFKLDFFAVAFGSHGDLLKVLVGVRWFRRGRACRPKQRQCRFCRWCEWPWPKPSGGSSDSRFLPKTGVFASWARNDAVSCCLRVIRYCPLLGVYR